MSNDPLQNTAADKSKNGDAGHGVNSNGKNQDAETCKDVQENFVDQRSVKQVSVYHYKVKNPI